MRDWMKRLCARGGAIAIGVVAVALLSSGAYTTIGSTDEAAPEETVSLESGPSIEDVGGVHGGPQARIHDGCDLAEGLTGNWTHGDYVSAVARASQGDSEKISEAAQSDCGKVDHSAQEEANEAKKAGKSAEPHGKSADSHGQSSEPHGKSDGEHGKSAEHKPSDS